MAFHIYLVRGRSAGVIFGIPPIGHEIRDDLTRFTNRSNPIGEYSLINTQAKRLRMYLQHRSVGCGYSLLGSTSLRGSRIAALNFLETNITQIY